MKGKLETFTIVTCGNCRSQERLHPLIRSAYDEALAQGWNNDEKRGWLCPLCSPPDLTKILLEKVNT